MILAYSIKKRFNGLREARLKLDNYACQKCGSKEKILVHHKKRRANRNKKDVESTINDLLTLCRSCHFRLHYEAGHLKPSAKRL
jgi:5-methylcytosine-specific restriction endonuclease McrA